jgi:hypothetical protein
MGVVTSYDERRNELREKLSKCLELARDMLDERTWGYSDMKDDYAFDVYSAVKKARDSV